MQLPLSSFAIFDGLNEPDINKAQNSNVEFYTLGGLKVDGAKSGQVLIRKTTNANGKVSFDKVLLK